MDLGKMNDILIHSTDQSWIITRADNNNKLEGHDLKQQP